MQFVACVSTKVQVVCRCRHTTPYMRSHTHTHTHQHTHAHIPIHLNTHTHTHHISIYLNKRTHTHTNQHTYTHAHRHVRTHTRYNTNTATHTQCKLRGFAQRYRVAKTYRMPYWMYNIYICIIYIYTYHNMCIYMCIYMCVYIFFTHRWSRSATVSQQFRNCCGSTHFDNQPVLSKSVGRVPQQFRNSSATVPQQFRNCCGTRPIVCWSVAEQKISIIQANLRDTQRLIE